MAARLPTRGSLPGVMGSTLGRSIERAGMRGSRHGSATACRLRRGAGRAQPSGARRTDDAHWAGIASAGRMSSQAGVQLPTVRLAPLGAAPGADNLPGHPDSTGAIMVDLDPPRAGPLGAFAPASHRAVLLAPSVGSLDADATGEAGDPHAQLVDLPIIEAAGRAPEVRQVVLVASVHGSFERPLGKAPPWRAMAPRGVWSGLLPAQPV